MNSIFSKKNKNEVDTIDNIASLSHTKWNCKYHIVFTPKYRRKIFYGQKQPHNFPEVFEFEIQIRTAKLLVPWILRRHGR